MSFRLDDTDRKILSELQIDAGQSLDEIAKKVFSSKTPVWNRIKKMKDYGIIGDTVSILNADKLGFEACFFVMIRTSEHDLEWQENFLQALKDRPQVQEALFIVATNINPFFFKRLAHDFKKKSTSSTCSTISMFKITSNLFDVFSFSGDEHI